MQFGLNEADTFNADLFKHRAEHLHRWLGMMPWRIKDIIRIESITLLTKLHNKREALKSKIAK